MTVDTGEERWRHRRVRCGGAVNVVNVGGVLQRRYSHHGASHNIVTIDDCRESQGGRRYGAQRFIMLLAASVICWNGSTAG